MCVLDVGCGSGDVTFSGLGTGRTKRKGHRRRPGHISGAAGNRARTRRQIGNVQFFKGDPTKIQFDTLCEQHGMPVMAYSPLGGPGASLLRGPTLARIGAARGCSAAAVALAWTIRSGNVIAIPESGSVAHVKENAVALSLTLTPQELQTLDATHPPPGR